MPWLKRLLYWQIRLFLNYTSIHKVISPHKNGCSTYSYRWLLGCSKGIIFWATKIQNLIKHSSTLELSAIAEVEWLTPKLFIWNCQEILMSCCSICAITPASRSDLHFSKLLAPSAQYLYLFNHFHSIKNSKEKLLPQYHMGSWREGIVLHLFT